MLDPLCLHNVLGRPSSGGELGHGSVAAAVGFPKLATENIRPKSKTIQNIRNYGNKYKFLGASTSI